jgi:uncharacterized repeat protein (TIGR01451 family)
VKATGADHQANTANEAKAGGFAQLNNPMLRPLHERMASLRQSPFGDNVQAEAPAQSGPATQDQSPATDHEERRATTKQQPTLATPKPAASTVQEVPEPTVTDTTAPVEKEATAPVQANAATPLRAKGAAPSPATMSATEPTVRDTQKASVLLARKSPVLSVETVGPPRIIVGRESVYALVIKNSGDVAAEDVVVSLNLPEWTDVVSAEASTGTAQPRPARHGSRGLQWHIAHLAANHREELLLKIVARESRPFDLAVQWDCRPVASQTMIEVQEPRLAITMEGPQEVLYGESQIYKLKVSNVGNGLAENVLVTLVPSGPGQSQAVSHNVGSIAAGQQKTIEVQLTARQEGRLQITVQAQGDGGVAAELAESVLVRRPSIEISIDGPQVQYVGAVANYRVHVRNSGTAKATDVKLMMHLPLGTKYVSGIEGGRLNPDGTTLEWIVGNLPPEEEQVFNFQCTLGLAGASRLEAAATGEGDLTASAATTTRVEARADLALDVKDPPGPVPVGKETTYELRVRNRGTNAAQAVKVVAYFSYGIEPISAEGAPNRVEPGQVVFNPISELPAGGEVVLKARARAQTAGNHIFRAEVHCESIGARLVSEETTHFYQTENP